MNSLLPFPPPVDLINEMNTSKHASSQPFFSISDGQNEWTNFRWSERMNQFQMVRIYERHLNLLFQVQTKLLPWKTMPERKRWNYPKNSNTFYLKQTNTPLPPPKKKKTQQKQKKKQLNKSKKLKGNEMTDLTVVFIRLNSLSNGTTKSTTQECAFEKQNKTKTKISHGKDWWDVMHLQSCSQHTHTHAHTRTHTDRQTYTQTSFRIAKLPPSPPPPQQILHQSCKRAKQNRKWESNFLISADWARTWCNIT